MELGVVVVFEDDMLLSDSKRSQRQNGFQGPISRGARHGSVLLGVGSWESGAQCHVGTTHIHTISLVLAKNTSIRPPNQSQPHIRPRHG